MSKTYLADKQTLDTINTKVGANSDAESGTPTTLFAGLKNIIKGIIELKNLLSDGKTRVANAITGKGISTATNATFATMANNINAITTLSQGTGDANVSAYDMVSGKTAYARGSKVTGTLPEYGAYTASQSVAYGGDSLYVRFPQGAYRSNGGSGYPEITVHQNAVASSIGLSSDKIKAGVNIMGVTGNVLSICDGTFDNVILKRLSDVMYIYYNGKTICEESFWDPMTYDGSTFRWKNSDPTGSYPSSLIKVFVYDHTSNSYTYYFASLRGKYLDTTYYADTSADRAIFSGSPSGSSTSYKGATLRTKYSNTTIDIVTTKGSYNSNLYGGVYALDTFEIRNLYNNKYSFIFMLDK